MEPRVEYFSGANVETSGVVIISYGDRYFVLEDGKDLSEKTKMDVMKILRFGCNWEAGPATLSSQIVERIKKWAE